METKRVETAELAAELRLAITRTARRLRVQAQSPLSASLTAALATVANHGPLTPSELARREGVRRPTATKLVAGLETEGYAVRAEDMFDGRSFVIAITDAGRDVLAELRARKDEFLAERLEALPPEDLETLSRAAGLLEGLLDSR